MAEIDPKLVKLLRLARHNPAPAEGATARRAAETRAARLYGANASAMLAAAEAEAIRLERGGSTRNRTRTDRYARERDEQREQARRDREARQREHDEQREREARQREQARRDREARQREHDEQREARDAAREREARDRAESERLYREEIHAGIDARRDRLREIELAWSRAPAWEHQCWRVEWITVQGEIENLTRQLIPVMNPERSMLWPRRGGSPW